MQNKQKEKEYQYKNQYSNNRKHRNQLPVQDLPNAAQDMIKAPTLQSRLCVHDTYPPG